MQFMYRRCIVFFRNDPFSPSRPAPDYAVIVEGHLQIWSTYLGGEGCPRADVSLGR